MTMKTAFGVVRGCRWAAVLAGGMLALTTLAFPPAPHHEVYGTVRDEFGNPLPSTGTEVLLEVEGSILARSPVVTGVEPGTNYRLRIPLDSGATPDVYKPTALRPTVPFRMRVRVGNTVYLPIEMTGAANLLTRPGESSRVDLTLGVDSDGDGIPDAWERALIAALGGGLGLGDIDPNADADGDGMSNLEEYLAGTYAFDPADGFDLGIVSTSQGRSLLEFTAIRGRAYSILGSVDMRTWTPVSFALPTDPSGTPARSVHQARDSRVLRPLVGPFTEEPEAPRFFRLIVR